MLLRQKQSLCRSRSKGSLKFESEGKLKTYSRRDFLKLTGAMPIALALSGCGSDAEEESSVQEESAAEPSHLYTKDKVPDPENTVFSVQYPGKDPIELVGHYWYNADAVESERKIPAIVEFNPYRRRDGTITTDSKMHPWFAYNEYLSFRIDLQGTGDSEGILTDEYTDEELVYCTQVIEQIAAHPYCDGNVGMMGKSWSAINSLMVSAHDDCPEALKAIIVCAGSDDRYNDDVHYMGGAMMFDNVSWPSSMWGWMALPPDPVVVGDSWKERWRERIQNANFFFDQWATHQTRDDYWSATSVRDHYDRVKVPVFILSGWQDGYKNPVPRVVSGLTAAGKPVSGLLGPWGHKYPFNGYPGPQIDWLHYIVPHWWDRWLKGKEPDTETEWPQLPVWLGESREPDKSLCFDDQGKWVAEDADWQDRTEEEIFYLQPENRLADAPADGEYTGPESLVFGTAMYETSSWGECGNDDLPGDQASGDNKSIYFDSEPLDEDIDCFGHPRATLNLSCSTSLASIAVRLCEISPNTEASHLVNYRFFNLCYREGDFANPQHIEPDTPFNVSIPLNLIGHTFKQGWRIRLSISPSFFPTMWQSPENPTITLYTGRIDGFPESTLMLPQRDPRPEEDQRVQALLPTTSEGAYVDPEDYVPTLEEARPANTERTEEPITVGDKSGVVVKKTFDNGRYQYGGPLQELWVDLVAKENCQVLEDDPLSMTGWTSSTSILERPSEGWRIRAETTSEVWTERDDTGEYVFRYQAKLQTFIGDDQGEDQPFEEKTAEGSVPRSWV
jgi:predicted acyl esterase